jgi:regulator of RNase E activity RraA
MSNLGFSINTHKHTVSNATLKKFAKLAVANISDVMSRTNGTVDLRPFHKGGRILGRAFTVKTAPGDNLMVHKAIDMAAPGDVIVVDAGGLQRNAIIGEIMSTLAASKKIAGFVIDGPIRDVESLGKSNFPVFARAISHRGPYKEGPGEINVTVSVDGMVVHPGDIIVGDHDGVFAIRPDIANELAALVMAVEKKEKDILKQIAKGTLDRKWVDQSLRAKGVLK